MSDPIVLDENSDQPPAGSELLDRWKLVQAMKNHTGLTISEVRTADSSSNPNAVKINVHCDIRPFERALAQVEKLSPLFPELVKDVLGLIESGGELVRLDVDQSTAAGAGECWIRLKPSDRFRELLTACGAGDFD